MHHAYSTQSSSYRILYSSPGLSCSIVECVASTTLLNMPRVPSADIATHAITAKNEERRLEQNIKTWVERPLATVMEFTIWCWSNIFAGQLLLGVRQSQAKNATCIASQNLSPMVALPKASVRVSTSPASTLSATKMNWVSNFWSLKILPYLRGQKRSAWEEPWC